MRKHFFRIEWVVLLLLGFGFSSASAQQLWPILGQEFGVGARALGMGGAFVSVANDYSASHWNPAGLGLIRRMEAFGSVGRLGLVNDDVNRQNETVEKDGHFTRLNAAGFVFPIPTYRGSLVFATGYNRVKNLDGVFASRQFINTPGDSVYHIGDEFETGYFGYWNFSGSIQLSPNFYFGGAINFWRGHDDYNWKFYEKDELDLWTFDTNILNQDQIRTKISGTNFKFGGLFTIGNILNVGGTIETPVTFKATENWEQSKNYIYFDDGSVQNGTTDAGEFQYKIKKPYTFALGASLKIPLLILSADARYNDWSQMAYKDSLSVQNGSIMSTYRETIAYRLGAEVAVPLTGVRLRAGYMFDPSPYQKTGPGTLGNRTFLTAGLGFIVDKQFTFDLAWVRGNWKKYHENYTEKIQADKVLFTAAFRF